MDIDWIRKKVVEGDYEYSAHAEAERQADKLMLHEIKEALLEGEMLEDYSNDSRGESCLVLGYGTIGIPLHMVCGRTSSDTLRVITVYIPTTPKWIDERTRRKI